MSDTEQVCYGPTKIVREMERQDIIRKRPGSACSSEPQSVTGRHTERNKSASERDGGRDSDKADIKRKRDRHTHTKL